MRGILYLTREPKFEVDNPTPKAKNMVNTNAKVSIGSWKMVPKKPTILFFNNKSMVKKSNTKLSNPEMSITGFLASHTNGLKIPAIMAKWALPNPPSNVGSKSPISKLFPP
jgi:hypothetical protein